MNKDWHDRIFSIGNNRKFVELALEAYAYQSEKNPVYRRFISATGRHPGKISAVEQIPFLPVEVFKYNKVICGSGRHEALFRSSGTGSMERSTHIVSDTSLYRESITNNFRLHFGPETDYHFFALLPSYLERNDSSLVYMMNCLMEESGREGGFYLDTRGEMIEKISRLRDSGEKVFLMGVSFALMDLAEFEKPDLSGVTVVETGGMKGRRKELTRVELHKTLASAFNTDIIFSEYGMTELLSQGWSQGNGIFTSPPWMKIMIRDPLDPYCYVAAGSTGAINIIDLANINSCCFIETSDLGVLNTDGSFSISGRLDASDIRGCNLLVQ